jgi:hypothetical protein
MSKLTIEEVGKDVIKHTLGHSIDMHITAGEIEDPELSALWSDAETAMNAIQLFLEEKLGVDFFDVI